MNDNAYIEGRKYEREDFRTNHPPVAEYEQCDFINCDFSGSKLTSNIFIDCRFTDCNLSLAVIEGTALRNVTFINCKMLGLRFDHADAFLLSLRFDRCTLDCSSFFKMKLKKTVFTKSSLRELDLTGADLTQAVFDQCDLDKTLFDQTVLHKADLRTSFNFQIDPDNNQVKKMKIAVNGLPGLLGKYDLDIHAV
jgi:fluoroquinolone resistance protein